MPSSFECNSCGACCRTFPIFASREDAGREPRIAAESCPLPEHLEAPGWAFQLYPLPFLESCGFLDDSCRCTIYATRPAVCRSFAAGSDQCQEARSRGGLPPLIPSLAPGPSGAS